MVPNAQVPCPFHPREWQHHHSQAVGSFSPDAGWPARLCRAPRSGGKRAERSGWVNSPNHTPLDLGVQEGLMCDRKYPPF